MTVNSKPTTLHEVIKNVPLPKSSRTPPPPARKYPFEEMEVGDMFFVPGKTKNSLSTRASSVGKKLDRKYVTRSTIMAETIEGWEPCDDKDPDAVVGVGVWRIK